MLWEYRTLSIDRLGEYGMYMEYRVFQICDLVNFLPYDREDTVYLTNSYSIIIIYFSIKIAEIGFTITCLAVYFNIINL